MLLRTPLLVFSFLVGCTELRFEGTGGTGGTGAAGASGGAGANSSSGAAGPGGAGATGGTGGNDCTAEVCDGLDNDCNGIADDPPEGSGVFCDCEWLSYDGKLYVACPTTAAFDQLVCPLGTELVVLQSASEQAALAPLVPTDSSAYVALRQTDGASSLAARWNWIGRIGMPPAWGATQPNDNSTAFAESVEDDRQQCGFLSRDDLDVYQLGDGACSGELNTRVLCEQVRDDCVEAAPCTLDLGCGGVFVCDDPDPVCQSVPVAETCNGLDDDCNMLVGDDNCACTPFVSSNGRKFKVCPTPARPAYVECGEGYRLAVPTSGAEFAFLISMITPGITEERWIGGFQNLGAPTPADGWEMLDGSNLLSNQWDVGEPSDEDGVESGEQDCLFLDETGLRDGTCSTLRGAFCEEVP